MSIQDYHGTQDPQNWPTRLSLSFINRYVESKFELSTFNGLLVIAKSILICQCSPICQINSHLPKFANKTNGTTCSREVPTTVVKATELLGLMMHVIFLNAKGNPE